MSEVNSFEVAIQESLNAIETKENLLAIAEQSKAIVTVDDANYKEVKDHKNALVKVRTSIDKKRTEIKKPYADAGKRIDAYAKELTAICEPEEKRLAQLLQDHEEKEQKAIQKIIDERIARLVAVGATPNGVTVGFMEHQSPIQSLHLLTQDELTDLIDKVRQAYLKWQEYQNNLRKIEAQAKAETPIAEAAPGPLEIVHIEEPAKFNYGAKSLGLSDNAFVKMVEGLTIDRVTQETFDRLVAIAKRVIQEESF